MHLALLCMLVISGLDIPSWPGVEEFELSIAQLSSSIVNGSFNEPQLSPFLKECTSGILSAGVQSAVPIEIEK